jgi:hypothetical protein
MKLHTIIIGLFLLTACVQGEAELNKRQARQIQKMVEYKVDSFRIAQEAICYQTVLAVAKPKADSVILSFQIAASSDTLNRPERPKKPEKPKVKIPIFEN